MWYLYIPEKDFVLDDGPFDTRREAAAHNEREHQGRWTLLPRDENFRRNHAPPIRIHP
jgi:hypothetical protein